jgi:hypothetical protein
MTFRDREYFIKAMAFAQASVNETYLGIAKDIECGEFSLAELRCDALKIKLGALNAITNQFADKYGG